MSAGCESSWERSRTDWELPFRGRFLVQPHGLTLIIFLTYSTECISRLAIGVKALPPSLTSEVRVVNVSKVVGSVSLLLRGRPS